MTILAIVDKTTRQPRTFFFLPALEQTKGGGK